MGLFSKKVEAKPTAKKSTDERIEKQKLVHRLEMGKVKAELTRANSKAGQLETKLELKDVEIEKLTESLKFYQKLENDREAIDAEKRVIAIEHKDLIEDQKELAHRTERLTKREERLEELENDEYKKGYSDGLADGLRKAHDITREDRKYMTMIAMSTNQSKAIESSVKALEGGFNDSESTKSTK